MRQFLYHIGVILLNLGPLGLIVLGVLDSSFLFMPLGNDLLMVALTARHHAMLPIYALSATAGSVAGCWIMDAVGRKGGEAGLERHAPRRRLENIKRKVSKNAAWALAVAALMPPPFPFTVFVIATAALEYPRKKLLGVIAVARFVRFSLIGLLAVIFGRHILRLAEKPEVQWTIIAIIIVSIAGSAYSIVRWARMRGAPAGRQV